ncbi:MAG: AAA family ATPase [Armatimonadetes bacterium]|nr:AAA family ATPase [Armatimonadota bacterium]
MPVSAMLERKEPLIYVVSAEESRVEAAILRHCEQPPARPLYRWSSTRGLEKLQSGVVEQVSLPADDARQPAQAPLVAVLNYIVHDCPDDTIFLLKDVHPYLRGGGATFSAISVATIRALRDAFYELRALGRQCKLVLLSPELVVPPDLEKELRIVDFALPTREELLPVVRQALRRAALIAQKDRGFVHEVPDAGAFEQAIVNAAVGLTCVEVEYVLENLLYVERRLTSAAPRQMVREKQQIIRKSGALEFIPAEDLEQLRVGGLTTLLHWLRQRKHVFDHRERASRDYGIDQVPRGVLLVGISGCGKSLVCKSIAQEWGCPLLRLDVGAIFDRWVGASEERIRKALTVAESVAPCILWVDEIEKGFHAGAGGDGGTSSRVLATFLVWMQEKRAPVFVAATANDITLLPPELLRSGRFDNRFFVGCPGDQARGEILDIHLAARRLDPGAFDRERLVGLSRGFTGAEIEQAVLDSAYDAFYEDRRADTADVVRNLGRSRPLVASLGPQMARILEMLETGRIELADTDTVPVKELLTTPAGRGG